MTGEPHLIEQIANAPWVGDGDRLLALLGHPDPAVRSASAVRIAQLHMNPAVGLPEIVALLDALAVADAVHPGIADAFWTSITYRPSAVWDDEIYEAHARPWILRVLEARRDRRELSTPVPGNDLEFYAHEVFDQDAAALGRLLDWGYESTVTMALDHGVLPDDAMRALLERLYAQAPSVMRARWLAVSYAVLEPEIANGRTAVLADDVTAPLLEEVWGNDLWTVRWIFVPPGIIDVAIDELFARNGWRASRDRLDPGAIGHITMPTLDGVTWRTEHPRGDVEVRIARDDATSHVRVIQIVQAFPRR